MRIWLGIGIVVLLAIIIIPSGMCLSSPYVRLHHIADKTPSPCHEEMIQR